MLLDELLIKVGVEADNAALKQLEAFLNQVGEGAEQAVAQFNEFVDSVSDLKDSADTLSDAEALQAWTDKLLEMDELFADFGGTVEDRAQAISDELIAMGASSEQVEQVLTALSARLNENAEETAQSTDKVKEHTEQVKENSEAVKENQEETESLTGSLVDLVATKLGIDGLGEAFERFGGKVEKANLTVGKITLGLTAAIGAAVGGLTAFVSSQMEALDSVRQLANVTGEAADTIYNLGLVAEVNGSSAQAAESSIASLSRTIGEAAAGVGRGAKTFEQYGLSAKNANGEIKSSLEVMGELSDKMQTMSNQEQIAMLSKLGIDESMIQTLRLGREELEAQMKVRQALTLGVGSEESATAAADFNDAMTDLAQIFKGMGEFLALRLAPTITDLIGSFKDWYLENSELVKGVLEGFGKFLNAIFWFIEAIDNVVSHTIGWKMAIYAIGAALMWVNRQMLIAFATNPIMWVIAAIVGLILLFDDFFTYLEGGESLLGEFWEPFKQALILVQSKWAEFVENFDVDPIGTVLNLVFDLITLPFRTAFATVVLLWNKLTGQDISLTKFSEIYENAKKIIIDKLKAAFDWVIELWNKVVGMIGGEPINIETNVKTNYSGRSISDALSQNIALAGSFANAPQLARAGAGNSTTNSQVDNSVVNNNTHANIHIHESKNARETGKEAARAIQNTGSPIKG